MRFGIVSTVWHLDLQVIGSHRKEEGSQWRSRLHLWKIKSLSNRLLPRQQQEKPQQGEVLAVGPGRRDDSGNRIPVDVKEGDKVLYSKYGGTEVTYGGEDYVILSSRDVLAILN